MWGSALREELEEKDCLWQFPRCPACNQGYNNALILPCSHPMCARCVASGERARSSHSGRPQPQCTLLCPCCRRPVELPCRDWSSAISCLPTHPTLRSDCVYRQTTFKQGSSGNQYTQDRGLHTSLSGPGSRAASSSILPWDGAVDLQEEEMEQSVYGLCFALDPSTAHPSLHMSNSYLTVAYHGDDRTTQENKMKTPTLSIDPETLPGICANVMLARGQYYWEVDVCNSSVYRIGVASVDGLRGWWLQRHNFSFCVVHDGRCETLCTIPPQIKILGVFLNIGGGSLSFYNPLTQEHLATLPTCFSPGGVIPALSLGHGKLRLRCGLPPPSYVFFSKDSTYRGPCFGCKSQWRREVYFQPVKKVIRKFEELAFTGSDRVSSFGLSCSTLNSNLDSEIPATFSGVQEGQEAGSE